jgi:hypothetical protein
VGGGRFAALLTAIALLALALRVSFPAADPPWLTPVGVVWHDEGAWVHNARNKALYGEWRVDEWNPIFIAPVFTGLEYVAFELFGVGVRQARLVSELGGLASVVLLGLAVRRVAGHAAGLIAAGLLATNYVYVMYDRAAIMEALMVAFIVASWYCSTRSIERPPWGAAAGVLAVLSYFTKAAAAFYLAAVGLAALWILVRPPIVDEDDLMHERTAAVWTLCGLVVTMLVAAAVFVLPHWTDYRFYNWQMSVTRKPSYDLGSLIIRLSWFPVLHDTFTRMWFALCVGIVAVWGLVLRQRRTNLAERLLLLWVVVGIAELLVHDVGNERRFVFLIPAFVALTAIVLGRGGGLLPAESASVSRRALWLASPAILYSAYILCAPLGRLPFLYVVRPSVRFSAALALLLGLATILWWPRAQRLLANGRWRLRAAAILTIALMTGDLVQFGQYAFWRTYKNYEASVMLGRMLPPGTLVQGKLANGLALENRIRPLFVGHEFGNYVDRKHRDDVRYILTYTDPRLGYEGSQILDVLEAYPASHVLMTFDVAETPSGRDRAALIDKFGSARSSAAREPGRARD